MAGYKAGEARILALIQGLSTFNDDNATIGDWTVLNLGKSDRYAILKPGDHGEPERHTMTRYLFPWITIIEVWHRWDVNSSDAVNLQALEDRVQAIINRLQPYRKTNDSGNTVLDAKIERLGLVNEIFNQDGGMEWLQQEVAFGWDEESAPAFAE